MAGSCPVNLAIAVADAGGMGAMGALMSSPDAIAKWAAEFRSRSLGPFQLNLWIAELAGRLLRPKSALFSLQKDRWRHTRAISGLGKKHLKSKSEQVPPTLSQPRWTLSHPGLVRPLKSGI